MILLSLVRGQHSLPQMTARHLNVARSVVSSDLTGPVLFYIKSILSFSVVSVDSRLWQAHTL